MDPKPGSKHATASAPKKILVRRGILEHAFELEVRDGRWHCTPRQAAKLEAEGWQGDGEGHWSKFERIGPKTAIFWEINTASLPADESLFEHMAAS